MMKVAAMLVLVIVAPGAHALSVLRRAQSVASNATQEASHQAGSPKKECSSIFIDANAEIAPIEGSCQTVSKKLTVDDVLFGYDTLFEQRKMFDKMRWKGMLLQQDPSDAFAIQMMLWKEQPDLMIEFGTNTGGGAVFFAEIMKQYNPNAHVITLDVADRLGQSWAGEVPEVRADSSPLWGTTIRHVIGMPPSKEVQTQVRALVKEFGAKKVFLNEDGNHKAESVFPNVEAYHDLVPECGWILFQDTKMDRLYDMAGPAEARKQFMSKYPGYKVRRDYELFLYTQHAEGFVQRVGPACK